MSLTGAIVATAVGVLLPVILSTSVGIVALALGKSSEWTLFGVLVISFAAAAIGGAVVVTVLLSRKHRIARLQADFIANVTHELRTPLTSIRMYSQTLEMGALNEEPEMFNNSVRAILRETEWLEAMIDRVLTWRAASKDMDSPNMHSGCIATTVQAAVDRFLRMIRGRDVDFQCKIDTEAMVTFDEQGMHSIVLNLLVNAFKYTGKNKKIELRLFDFDEHVVLEIEDNGIGFSQSEEKKIFDPFYRVDSRLSGKSSGAGLGLAIVRHQVILHKGSILVRSEPGKGSKFIVQFPAVPVSKGKSSAQNNEE
ncbi:MAG: HAMP domain-containing histidine kinase [Deltaproteobacteria bacterium]|nr:HAMP domain-containing histidine kinase [Deltaproteobacteria bacterium]MBN2670392.1 HAMP domain-containing histidine kinase [Deltaproteobacteria bacterium]